MQTAGVVIIGGGHIGTSTEELLRFEDLTGVQIGLKQSPVGGIARDWRSAGP
ncbi:hypothetical protein GCM10022419_079720 [Nonomuraea rosea]|uniref:Uncharacterized protein n=1 Tax=Nonomuraea rosea TaxID=638574 RepID=A0ABP6YMJ6_9ACTN